MHADSTIDMDEELFALLPQVTNANAKERNKILVKWIDELGHFSKNEPYYRRMFDTLEYEKGADLNWLGDQQMLGKN